jgi:hypothetical protein
VAKGEAEEKRSLSDAHREHLRTTAGLTDETIAFAGVYTDTVAASIARIINYSRWRHGSVLVFPYFHPGEPPSPDRVPIQARVRPDAQVIDQKKSRPGKTKYKKYIGRLEQAPQPYFPPRSLAEGRLRDARMPLLLTEGEKKTLLLDQLGYATVGAPGVYSFHDVAFRQEEGAFKLHPFLLEHAVFAQRDVYICFDSDYATNRDVARAAKTLAGMVLEAGAQRVLLASPPHPAAQKKGIGVDDYYVSHGSPELGAAAVQSLLALAQPVEAEDLREPYERVAEVCRGAPVPNSMQVPHGYYVSGGDELWLAGGMDAAGKNPPTRVAHTVPLILRLLVHNDTDEERCEIAFERTRDGESLWRKHIVTRRATRDARTAVAELSDLGAPITSNNARHVVDWFANYEHLNESRIPRATAISACGWHKLAGRRAFALGEEIVRADPLPGTKPPEVVLDTSGKMRQLAAPLVAASKGNLDAHLETLWAAWEHDDIAATMICAAFAAPLLKPLSAPNFAVHLPGDSSTGKSSMLRIAASVYGDPASREWLPGWDNTGYAVELRAAFYNDLPLCFDESGTVKDEQKLQQWVYSLMNGSGRMRGNTEGGLRETLHWRTIVLSTGERYLIGDTADTGAQARVLQLYVKKGSWANRGVPLEAGDVDALRDRAVAHHGHAGRAWLEWLARVPDWRGYRKEYGRVKTLFQEKAESGIAARQSEYLAVLAVAETLLFRLYGIGSEDGATMARWLRTSEARAEVKSLAERGLDALRDWVSRSPDAFPTLAGFSDNDADPDEGHQPVRTHGSRAETLGYLDSEAVWFISSAIRDFFVKQEMDFATIRRSWRDRGWLWTEGDRLQRMRRVGARTLRMYAIRREVFDTDQFPVAQGGQVVPLHSSKKSA